MVPERLDGESSVTRESRVEELVVRCTRRVVGMKSKRWLKFARNVEQERGRVFTVSCATPRHSAPGLALMAASTTGGQHFWPMFYRPEIIPPGLHALIHPACGKRDPSPSPNGGSNKSETATGPTEATRCCRSPRCISDALSLSYLARRTVGRERPINPG